MFTGSVKQVGIADGAMVKQFSEENIFFLSFNQIASRQLERLLKLNTDLF